MMAGYSGKPLAQKLGINKPMIVYTVDAPDEYRDWLGTLSPGVHLRTSPPKPLTAAHVFVTRKEVLRKRLALLRRTIDPAGFVWVSWPKKSARVETDVTEDTIRELALPQGWVDVKVCAVSDVWSGLKLVVRKTERPQVAQRADAG
jgi:hypothetical protein